MPLYEFECEDCKTRFERIQKFSDANPEVCPTCGKGPVKRLLSSPAIQFKGSGFYITDYAKKSSSEAGSKSATEKSGGDSKSGDGGSTSTSSSTPASTSTSTSTDSGSSSSDKKS